MSDPDTSAARSEEEETATGSQPDFSVRLGSATAWRPGAPYERVRNLDDAPALADDEVVWLDFYKPRSTGVQPVYMYDVEPIAKHLDAIASRSVNGKLRGPDVDRVLDAVRSTRLGFQESDAITGVGVELVDERMLEAADTYCGIRAVRVTVVALQNCLVTLRDRPEYWMGRSLDDKTRVRIRSLKEPPQLEPFASRLTFQDPVQREWVQRESSTTAGDLGALALLELSSTFDPVAKELARLLEGAEDSYFSVIDAEALSLETEALQRGQRSFFQLGSVLTSFGRSLGAFSEHSPPRDWFSDSGSRADVQRVERNHRDAIAAVQQLRQDLRASLDMMASTLASKQLVIAYHHEQRAEEQVRLAEEQRERNESFMRAATLIASLVLLPTLVATFYGANVGLPFRNQTLGTASLVAAMIGAALVGWLLIKLRDPFR